MNIMDNFTSRCVITSDPELRSSQIRLPYKALVEMLQQTIINVLHRSYSISYDAAWKIWYKSKIKKDPRVYNIISNLIHDSREGLPLFVNRPPTNRMVAQASNGLVKIALIAGMA